MRNMILPLALVFCSLVFCSLVFCTLVTCITAEQPLIKSSADGLHFVRVDTGARFVVWGVNYDHDARDQRLLEDYWIDEWDTVAEDFAEIRELGANTVRIHLQTGKFMRSAEETNPDAFRQLSKLCALAEQNELYLDITGLGCYHKRDVPAWYDALDESGRWAVQSRFWEAIAKTCAESSAVFCYDLMNEPILPGKQVESDWLAGEFAGKHFVQRISLDLAGRERNAVAKAWVEQLVASIRKHDREHMITVGVIPWALTWPNAKPVFHDPEVGGQLDFVSVHFYPEKGEVEKALAALKTYELGKPLVIEEMFPLKCGIDEMKAFIEQSSDHTDGWISFYWGKTEEEYEAEGTIQAAIIAQWLKEFRRMAPEVIQQR